jgi:hypothetical protein
MTGDQTHVALGVRNEKKTRTQPGECAESGDEVCMHFEETSLHTACRAQGRDLAAKIFIHLLSLEPSISASNPRSMPCTSIGDRSWRLRGSAVTLLITLLTTDTTIVRRLHVLDGRHRCVTRLMGLRDTRGGTRCRWARPQDTGMYGLGMADPIFVCGCGRGVGRCLRGAWPQTIKLSTRGW